MPDPSAYDNQAEFMKACVPMMVGEGKDQDQAVAACMSMWAQKNAEKATVEKTEADGQHPASHYLVVEDPQSPSTWHLRVKDASGKPDHGLMGAAWAALHEGYRGNTYEGPKKQEAIDKLKALYASEKQPLPGEANPQKFAIKATGDYEADITGIPFGGRDSDGQWFDASTDTMPEDFPTPAVMYQHSIAPGGKGYQPYPEVIGKVVPGSMKKEADGWHVRVIFDKANELARRVWEAIKNGAAAVSSGSLSHLARLEVKGQIVPYSKNTPGRIAVWPWAEISIWDKGNGNFNPSHRLATALPVKAMRKIYETAGIPFPDQLFSETDDGVPEAVRQARQARIAELRRVSKETLKKHHYSGEQS